MFISSFDLCAYLFILKEVAVLFNNAKKNP